MCAGCFKASGREDEPVACGGSAVAGAAVAASQSATLLPLTAE